VTSRSVRDDSKVAWERLKNGKSGFGNVARSCRVPHYSHMTQGSSILSMSGKVSLGQVICKSSIGMKLQRM
jgi:hypothetical protein